MSRILLVDDSPHAQRMGERILSEEGYEVVTVSNADSALIRLEDVDPDVVLADTVMPGRTGFEICQYLKMSPRHRHVRVILTAGVLEPLDEEQTRRVEADAALRKPLRRAPCSRPSSRWPKPRSRQSRGRGPGAPEREGPGAVDRAAPAAAAAPFVAVVDAEQVRAAVTVALDAAMGNMVDEIARRVVAALHTTRRAEPVPRSAPADSRCRRGRSRRCPLPRAMMPCAA